MKNTFQQLYLHCKLFLNKYPVYILTIFLILVAILVQLFFDIEKSAQVGDWLAGFAGTLAFLWLIASFQQQKDQLMIQSQELQLQREAIQLQAKELKNIGKFSALEQINVIVDKAIKDVEQSDTPIKNYAELMTVFTTRKFVEDLDIFFYSTDRDNISKTYQVWIVQEAEIRKFVARIATALKIYLGQTLDKEIDYSLDDIQFLHNNLYQIKYIPYLNETYAVMQSLIMMLQIMEPTLKKIQLAGWTATLIDPTTKDTSQYNKEIFDPLTSVLDKNKLEYPKIYKLYKSM